MKVLVVGTGAREHAICDALIKDDVELYALKFPPLSKGMKGKLMKLPNSQRKMELNWLSSDLKLLLEKEL